MNDTCISAVHEIYFVICDAWSCLTLRRQTEALTGLQTAQVGCGTILNAIIVLSMDHLRKRYINAAIN